MNKKLIALRASQNIELKNATDKLAAIRAELASYRLPDTRIPKEHQERAFEIFKEERELEKTIKTLMVEVADKKYASEILYSDVNPFEVIEERTPNLMIVRAMNAVETKESREARLKTFVPGGFCGHFDDSCQKWDITSNPEAMTFEIRKHKNGYWYNAGGSKFFIDTVPHKHYDFNF